MGKSLSLKKSIDSEEIRSGKGFKDDTLDSRLLLRYSDESLRASTITRLLSFYDYSINSRAAHQLV